MEFKWRYSQAMSTNSTSLRASEPVPEAETDVAEPGAQLGSVCESLLAIFPMVN